MPKPLEIPRDQVRAYDGKSGSAYWAVVDGYVVDATSFLDSHPGGLRKLLSADTPAAGATGGEFGFSLSRGRNAHFGTTGQQFQAGVRAFRAGKGERGDDEHDDDFLPPCECQFGSHGKVVILGRLGD